MNSFRNRDPKVIPGIFLIVIIVFIFPPATRAQEILGTIKVKTNGGIQNLRVISVTDAIAAGNGVVKVRLPGGVTGAADLVSTSHASASPVRINTTYGIKSWRKENLFSTAYGSNLYSDIFYAMDLVTGGGLVMAGFSSGYSSTGEQFLIKTNSSGDLTFGAIYGTTTATENCQAIVERTEGGYFLAGNNFVGMENYEFETFTDANGTFQHAYIYHIEDYYTACNDAIQGFDNYYVSFGSRSPSGSSYKDILVHSYDANGNGQWSYTYISANGATIGRGIVQRPDGGYIGVGSISSSGGNAHYCLINTNGSLQSAYTIGDTLSTDVAMSVVKAQAGGYVFTGYSNFPGSYDVWIRKQDNEGFFDWGHYIGGSGNDRAEDIVLCNDGGFAITGYTNSFGAGGMDILLIKTDSLGNAQWGWVFGGTGTDYGYSIEQATDGNFYVAGSTTSWGSGTEAILVRFSPDGHACLGYDIEFNSTDNEENLVSPELMARKIDHLHVIRDTPFQESADIRSERLDPDLTHKKTELSRLLITPNVTTICN